MIQSVKDLINGLLRAVEYEREAERARHIEEIKKLSGQEREAKGRALIDLNKRKVGRALGGDYLYKFRKNKRRTLPDTQLNVGDQVIISQFDPNDVDNPTGTVYEVTGSAIVVACGRSLPMNNSRPIRLDLYVNDITFQRMTQALTELKGQFHSKLQAILSGHYSANSTPKGIENAALNDLQNRAVDYALANNGYYSIQGPPGTGKTHTAAHLIAEIVKSGQRVLVTADSNAAVDNILRKLVALGERPLRIGNPIRVNRDLKQHTLDYKIVNHYLYRDYVDTEAAIEVAKVEQAELERPTGKVTRGLKVDQLLDLYQNGGQLRGVNKQLIKRFKPWLKAQLNIDLLYERLREIKDEIQAKLLASHAIICSTNSTAGCDLLLDEHFDWVVVDEAAQASIPSSLIAILKGERFVLVGDHFQLPPVVISREAKELKLDQSLMDYLAQRYPYQLMRLNVQYRMHQSINDLVGCLFYDGQLLAHHDVSNRHLPFDEEIIELIQVVGQERILKDSKSYYNQAEIDVVAGVVAKLVERGLTAEQIAVISPYKAQVGMLLKRLGGQCEIDTVDAFQGREKDVVILSFVRSNSREKIGFLRDYRRLNVSISRAKCKLILIGDFKTLRSAALFERLYETLTLIDGVKLPEFN